MDRVVFDLMAALVHLGGCARYLDIVEASGYHRSFFSAHNGALIARGWLLHRSPLWLLTERGKIAFAIETGRRSRTRVLKAASAKRPLSDCDCEHFTPLYGAFQAGGDHAASDGDGR